MLGAREREKRDRRKERHWSQGCPGGFKSRRQPQRWSLIPGSALRAKKGRQGAVGARWVGKAKDC